MTWREKIGQTETKEMEIARDEKGEGGDSVKGKKRENEGR